MAKRKSARRKEARQPSKAKKPRDVKQPASTAETSPVTTSESRFPVVGIGASAGGLEALEQLFGNMPPDPGMAFVVVTHQHPDHVSMLPELLRRRAPMPVIDAEDGIRVEPNHIYVDPPGGHLTILKGTLHRIGRGEKEAPRLPIDYFFRSLAQDQKERAICIILSGTATDGTLGLQAIKGESGMAMVQEPQSARYSGMPSNAIATGLVDYVLTPPKMPQQLIAYAAGPYLTRRVPQEMPIIAGEPLQKILALVRSRTGHDFSRYKDSTIRRRVERRMSVHAIGEGYDYVRYLTDNPGETDILFKELLIRVTSFFRDPTAWDALTPYLEELIKVRSDGSTLRAWVPGCATGEEAFSLAMVVRECMDRMNRHLPVQIFGTDLDAEAIDLARAGQYPEGIDVDVSPQRLQRFFVREDNTYQVRKDIRELTIFAPHNVIKDAPFSRLGLLSCRNLLIYLNADLQQKLLPIFHYALEPGGLLFLGPSETIGSSTKLFDSLDKHWKIYRRKEGVAAMPHLFFHPIVPAEGAAPLRAVTPDAKQLRIIPHIERMLLNRFAPVSIVANHRGDISFIHGRAGTRTVSGRAPKQFAGDGSRRTGG